MTSLDNFKFYVKKTYSDGFYNLEVLELIIDEYNRPYGLLTVLDEYSEHFKCYVSKRDIDVLKDLEPEKALDLLYKLILERKVYKQKLAHKDRGQEKEQPWVKDYPSKEDSAMVTKWKERYPIKPFSGPDFVVSKY